jgi:hypothetical protein
MRWMEAAAFSITTAAKKRRAVSFFRGDGFARAFRTWADACEAQRGRRSSTSACLYRLGHRSIVCAFNTWSEMARAVGSARSIVGHAIATWRSRVASRAFHTLAEYVGGLVRTRTLAHVALSRLRRQGELRAIGQWKLVSEERAKASTRLHRAADLWCGRGVAIALFKWRFQLAYARMAQLLGKRWIYRHVARALRQWHHTPRLELPR